jgi:hypothetical protein
MRDERDDGRCKRARLTASTLVPKKGVVYGEQLYVVNGNRNKTEKVGDGVAVRDDIHVDDRAHYRSTVEGD